MSWLLGLRGRLTAALLAISVLTLAIAAGSLLAPLNRLLRDDALVSLTQTARTAEPTFDDLDGSAIRPGSPQLRRAALDLRLRTGAEVVVLNARGKLLSATELDRGAQFTDVARAMSERKLVARIVTVGDEDEAQVAIPLQAEGHRFGLSLRKSLGDLSAAQRVVRRAMIVSALIALAVALLTGMALATRLVRRVTVLRDTALRVADLGPIAEVHIDDTRDEVGDLTRAFATMQTRLREQEQARRTFVSTASHELRNPLASLRLMLDSAAEALDTHRPDLDDVRDQLARALGQTERLGKLSADLLDLSRIDADLPLRSELVELSELARSVLAEFEPRALHTGASLELDAPSTAWAVADPGSLAQILRILLDNALRYSPPGTPIRVQVASVERRPTVTVTDGGPGIVPDDAMRIFERFERGTNVGSHGGFGLGLAIGRQLAHKMGGDLDLAPNGSGGRFALSLPAASVRLTDPS